MTLSDVLKRQRSCRQNGITFIESNNVVQYLSYSELYDRALKALGYLQTRALKPGDELVFQIDDNETFVIVFWACMLGGIVPVPLTVASTPERQDKVLNIWRTLKRPILVTSQRWRDVLLLSHNTQSNDDDILREMLSTCILTDEVLGWIMNGEEYSTGKEEIAFIQFSSGSTGNPKGVVLTHGNLISNISLSEKHCKITSEDVMLSWMPLTHDMGLIGFHLNPLYSGANQILIPADLFIRKPAVWMENASQYKATILCSPNFGYSHLLKHIESSENLSWDLSDVRLIFNGAEPISAALCDRFMNCLERLGLKPQAMYPVYGLAEATLAVSFSALGDRVSAIRIDRKQLAIGDRIRDTAGDADSVTFVKVGCKDGYCCSIRVVDDRDKELPDSFIGHLQIKGNSVTSGYYNNPADTKKLFATDSWVRTGDLGFLKDESLYVTGRHKDIFFVNGQNYYSHDLERCLEFVDGVEAGKVVVVGCTSGTSGEEEVLVFVVHRGDVKKFLNVYSRIKVYINEFFGFVPKQIIPVHQIPKTTSGKLQRYKLAEWYKLGEYNEITESLNHFLELEASQRKKVGAASDVEKKLSEIWAGVLNDSAPGVTDNFFESGGNSLKLGQLLSRVHQAFEVELEYSILPDVLTIRSLASVIENQPKTSHQPIQKASTKVSYNLSSVQHRLFHLWSGNPNATAYNVPTAFLLHGKLDVARLAAAARAVVGRHDILRVYFFIDQGVPRQAFASIVLFDLTVGKSTYEELRKTLEHKVVPFDLEKAPLFRIEVIEVSDSIHALFLDFHHIIADGISVGIFLNDLFRSYHGAALPRVETDYKDFVQWESQHVDHITVQQQEKYWSNVFAGGVPRLSIQNDFSRPKLFDSAGAKIVFPLERDLIDSVRTLARKEKTTLFTLLFTAYTVLLSKYCGQNELVVGVPVARRTHAQLQEIMGMFVNNLAIRCSLNHDISFTRYLEVTRTHISEAFSHQDYPFDKLIKLVKEKRDPSRNSLFDTMFVYQNMDRPNVDKTGLSIERYYFDPGFSKFDISLEIFDDEDDLQFSIEYATALFKQRTIERLGCYFLELLRNIVLHPSLPLWKLAIANVTEISRLTYDCNKSTLQLPRAESIHELIENTIRQYPKRTAISEIDTEQKVVKSFTFQEIGKKSNQLANVLMSMGKIDVSPVVILLDRTVEFIVSVMAILKTGRCFLPIDKKTPAERIKFIVNDCGASLVLTDNEFEKEIKKWHGSGEKVKWDVVSVSSKTYENAPDKLNEKKYGELAYVIYTSGTTGNPKGVKISHRSLINYVISCDKNFVRGDMLSFALFSSMSFDLTLTSIFVPLVTGNSIFSYPDDSEIVIQRVVDHNNVQLLKATPSHLKVLKEAAFFKTRTNRSTLRRLIIGGEILTTQLAGEIENLFGGEIEIYNEYGPTEATVGCMLYKFDRIKDDGVAVPIGLPIYNTQIYILDGHLKPVPINVPGEIYIAGDGVAQGYISNADLEAERFIENPFIKGDRMYKTGDVAIRGEDDIIQFIGRGDRQVKINGHRIELEEIERYLLYHESVSDTTVMQKLDINGEAYLCAYLVLRAFEGDEENRIEEVDFRSFLSRFLPTYMIPRWFIKLDSIALTINGKIDYNLLPEPEQVVRDRFEEAVSDIEKAMVDAWRAILGNQVIGVSDNFFDLGGDSIKAVQITSRLLDKNISISVKDMMAHQTIKQICSSASFSVNKDRYSQGIVSGIVGLTPIYSWFRARNFANPNFYNQSVLLKLKSKIDLETLETAFVFLIKHHDGLRMNYDPLQGIMFINNDLLNQPFEVPVFNLVAVDGKAVRSEIENECFSLKRSFNINGNLLLRAAVILSQADSYLFITAHHLIIDGVSWRILLEDLYNAYNTIQKGDELRAPQKTASIIDWATKVRESLNNPAKAGLNGVAHNGNHRNHQQDTETIGWSVADMVRATRLLDYEQTNSLMNSARRVYRTDSGTLLNVALLRTLAMQTNSMEFVVEQEGHGRNIEGIDVSRTVGWLTSIYPVHFTLSNMNIDENIREVKTQLEKARGSFNEYFVENARPGEISEIRFNYLGAFGFEAENDLFQFAHLYTGPDSAFNNNVTAKLEINCMTVSGSMIIDVTGSASGYHGFSVNNFTDALMNNLVVVLNHVKENDRSTFSTSDFDVALDKEDIEMLFY